MEFRRLLSLACLKRTLNTMILYEASSLPNSELSDDITEVLLLGGRSSGRRQWQIALNSKVMCNNTPQSKCLSCLRHIKGIPHTPG
jgi:hypothetical protein